MFSVWYKNKTSNIEDPRNLQLHSLVAPRYSVFSHASF